MIGSVALSLLACVSRSFIHRECTSAGTSVGIVMASIVEWVVDAYVGTEMGRSARDVCDG